MIPSTVSLHLSIYLWMYLQNMISEQLFLAVVSGGLNDVFFLKWLLFALPRRIRAMKSWATLIQTQSVRFSGLLKWIAARLHVVIGLILITFYYFSTPASFSVLVRTRSSHCGSLSPNVASLALQDQQDCTTTS